MNPYVRLPRVPMLSGRHDFIVDRCRGKRVLHLGCVDAGLLLERFQRGELLHQKLAVVAGELWGIDLDADGIAFLRRAGFDNLIVADVCQFNELEALRHKGFDVVLAPEVVEHLLNPGLFLEELRAFVGVRRAELIVSVPNAFRLATLRRLLGGVEYVHPDHNYWFSYHTITNLLRKCGFEVDEVWPYSFEPHHLLPSSQGRDRGTAGAGAPAAGGVTAPFSRTGRAVAYVRSLPMRALTRWAYCRTPFFCDGLLVVAHAVERRAAGE